MSRFVGLRSAFCCEGVRRSRKSGPQPPEMKSKERLWEDMSLIVVLTRLRRLNLRGRDLRRPHLSLVRICLMRRERSEIRSVLWRAA